MTREDSLSIIERSWAAYIILAVGDHPYSSKTEIMRLEDGNEKTKFLRLQELIEAGLIKYCRTGPAGIPKLILTAQGEEVRFRLREIDDAIKTAKARREEAS